MENVIDIRSEVGPIFKLAAEIETWPAILPHYRSVEIIEVTENGRLADMSAWRGKIPVRWQAFQTVDSEQKAVSFHHTHGFTKGMEVHWHFEPLNEGGSASTRVTISHELAPRRPVAVFESFDQFVGRFFIDYIATKTLAKVKEIAEHGSHGSA